MVTYSYAAYTGSSPYSYTPTNGCVKSNTPKQDVTWSSATWSIEATQISTGNYVSYVGGSNPNVAFGSAANPYSKVVLSTDDFSGKTITAIKLDVWANKNSGYSGYINIGGIKVADLIISNTTGASISIDKLSASGKIELVFENSVTASGSGKNGSVNLGGITINFTEGSSPVTPAAPVVSFKISDGTDVPSADAETTYEVTSGTAIGVSCENATSIKVSKDGSAFSTLHGASGSFNITEAGSYTFQGVNGTTTGTALTVKFAIKPEAPTVSFTGMVSNPDNEYYVKKGTEITFSSNGAEKLLITTDKEAETEYVGSSKTFTVNGDIAFTVKGVNGSVESTSVDYYFFLLKETYEFPTAPVAIYINETKQLDLGEQHPALTFEVVTEIADITSDGLITPKKEGESVVNVSWAEDDTWAEGTAMFNLKVRPEMREANLRFLHEVIRGKLGVGVAAQAAYYDGDGEVKYTSSNEDVVKVNPTTGMITPADVLAVGEAVITATVEATELYKGGTASYTVIIEKTEEAVPETAMFDFRVLNAYGLTTYEHKDGTADDKYEHNVSKPVTSFTEETGTVTMTLGGTYRSWTTKGSDDTNTYDFRLYTTAASGNIGNGEMTLSVAAPYTIEKITINVTLKETETLDDKFTVDNGTLGVNDWIPAGDVSSVKFTRKGSGNPGIRTITVLVKGAGNTGEIADLKFDTKVYYGYVCEQISVNPVSSPNLTEGKLSHADVSYTIDNLTEGEDYTVDASDAENGLKVSVKRPGVYTLRAKTDANEDLGLLAGFAIMRLNIFPTFEVVSENHIKHQEDVVVFPAEGGKISFVKEPSGAYVMVADESDLDFKRCNEIEVTEDGHYRYMLQYAETEYTHGGNTIHAFVTPKAPIMTKNGNYHVITLADGQSAQGARIMWHAFRFNANGGAAQAPARAAADDWTEEGEGTISHSIEIPSDLGQNEIFVIESKAVKHTGNSVAGDLYSDQTMVGYNADGSMSGIEDIIATTDAPVEYYNLQGIKVEGELAPGVYIRRQGARAEKIVIR